MTHRTDLSRGRDVVARWCVLAERRLDHLTELFETGRWRRYHSETAFLENIREAKAAVETWHDLLTREASLDSGGIDISWHSRTGVISPPWSEAPRDVAVIVPQPEPLPAHQGPAASKADALEQTAALALDILTMQERYPLLRNAL